MWLYYLLLASAILLEVIGTCLFTAAKGIERPWFLLPGVILWGFAILSFNFSLKGIEVSMAYAIWSAVGIALVTIIGFKFFNNDFHWVKALFILVIIVGVLGLTLSDHFLTNKDSHSSDSTNNDQPDLSTRTND